MDDVINVLHFEFRRIRKIIYIISTPIFQEIYNKIKEQEEKQKVDNLIKERNKKALIEWLQNHQKEEKDYYNMNMRDLRKEAQKMGISDYKFLPKQSLLSSIYNHEKTKNINDTDSKCTKKICI